MGIEINLVDLNIGRGAEIMEGVRISNTDDIHFNLERMDIHEYAKVLSHLEIDPLLNKLKQQAQTMDKNSAEYLEIRDIVSEKQWNKDQFVRCAIKHISEFSQGVFASIIANYISK